MKSVGRVVNSKDDIAEIAVGRHADCKRCGACLASLDAKQRTLLAANEQGAVIGDLVEIEIPPAHTVGAAFLVFIAPLLAALAGAYLGHRVARALGWPVTAVAAGLGILAFMLLFVLLRSVERRVSQSRMGRIVRIMSDED
jgi:sigma-E factor negative regulatory protein RseC